MESEIKEKIAAGLRNMKNKPDAFLWCGEENVLDNDYILGLPVLFSSFITDPMTDMEVCVIPIWTLQKDYGTDRKLFLEGYNDY